MSLAFDSSLYWPASAAYTPAQLLNSAKGYDGWEAKAIESALMETLLGALDDATKPELPSIVMKEPRRKWHLVSAIQKSVRRSDVDHAVRLAVAMQNSTEADSLWRRLCVMTLEDIGIANPVLVATVLAVAGKKAWREKHGGPLLTAFLVDRMAQGHKSRMFCHLMCYAGASERFADARTHWADLDLTDAAQYEHLLPWLAQEGVEDDGELPLIEGEHLDPAIPLAALASKALAGDLNYLLPGEDPKDRNAKRQYSSGSGPIHERALDDALALPSLWRYIISRARSMGLEGLIHAIPATVPRVLSEDVSFVTSKLPPMEILSKLPSVAFDKHTIEGKRAIARFGKNCAPVRAFLHEHFAEERREAALGSAVFYAEGGEPMTPVLQSPLGVTVQRSEHQAFATKYGVSGEVFDQLHAVVGDHIEELNNARRFVLGS